MRKTLIGFVLAVGVVVSGCGSKSKLPDTAEPAAPPTAEAKTETPPPPPNPDASAAPEVNAPDPTETLASLNMMVSDFSMSRGRLPASLEECVALKVLPAVPAAPPGKKFAIDPKLRQVVLVNR